jgi:OOP family OmpA-OmpF porin
VLFLVCNLFAGFAHAQLEGVFSDLPTPPNEFGKCYAKCKIPDQYEEVTVTDVVTPATSKTELTGASYETVVENVMVKEASQKFVYVPATYETIDKRILVKEGGCVVKKIPAVYNYNSEKTLVEPASGRWVKKVKDASCLSANPDDCYVMCYEEIPAKYTYNTTKFLVTSERYDTTYTDAVYETIRVEVIKTPARYDVVEIPAVYKDVKKQVLRGGCQEEKLVTVDGKYKTRTEKRLVRAGGYTGWVEILCSENTNSSMISRVQQALNAAGYNVGTADGVMGVKTQAVLKQYQEDKGLPVGNLNIATLKSLGIEQ